MTTTNSSGHKVEIGASRIAFESERALAAIEAAVSEGWTRTAEMAEDLAYQHSRSAAHALRAFLQIDRHILCGERG